mgnify:FL=1
MNVAIIGAGAAGCFAAIQIKRNNPKANVTVYEAGIKPLVKVAVTGGGRCNLTNSFDGIRSLDEAYPRGARLLKRLFRTFDYNDVYQWFESEGVSLTTQEDECVFPVSQDAMEIVNTLVRLMRSLGVKLITRHRVAAINHEAEDGEYLLTFSHGDVAKADAVVVTAGGSPQVRGLEMYEKLGLEIVSPVPSLFSLNLEKNHPMTAWMGTVVNDVQTRLVGTKLSAFGPLLITHWGVSGPAILKLSSYAARILAENDYKAQVAINWFGQANEAEVTSIITEIAEQNQKKLVSTVWPERFNNRMWCYLIDACGLRQDMRWGELGKKGLNKLVALLTNHTLNIVGKNKYKEEFVTCGGVALSNVNSSTLESKKHPHLYFAGEILDVDAITGGFNLQAAWTMGFVVAEQFKP